MKDISFPRMYINSLLVGGVKTILVIFIASLLGYVLGKFKFPGRNVIFILILMLMMVPLQVILIPMFILIKDLGWINSYWGLIIPGILSPYSIFLLRQYMHNIPNELTDAARIDGCSEFGIYWRIVLPLIIPALATVGIIKFMWEWEVFLWPLVVSQSADMFTIPVGISFLCTVHWVRYELVMAANTLAAIPMVIIFIMLQKHIVQGITLSGLKG
jgi:multiple sugar transport system permease protein